ncbi:MAG: monothiol glutaredoxin grx4 [Peltula sp. TS41687]|nr:MAG: monothiol glutaredoxin grx4 [Peltula sp. TS41687]
MSSSSSIETITSNESFEHKLSDVPSHTLLVLNFFTDWASPCKQMESILSDLANMYTATTATFVNINAEELADVAERYNVSAVPYLVLLKDGKVAETVSGSDATNVRSAIEQHAGKPQTSTAAAAAAAKLPPEQKVEKPGPANDGSNTKDLSSYAPTSSDPATAPEMTASQLPSTSTASAKEELQARLKGLVSAAPVMLFMKGTPSVPQCGFSKQVVALLRERGVRYGFFNILADDEVRQGLKEYAQWPTFPQLWVDGDLVGGLDIVKDEIKADPEFLKQYSVGKKNAGGPGSAEAETQAPTAA